MGTRKRLSLQYRELIRWAGSNKYKDIKVKSIRLNQERVNASNNVEKKKDEEEPNLERTTFNETLVQMHFTSWLF